MLALMDVQREIYDIEIEADVEHKFDDLVINNTDGTKIYCQMKDFKEVKSSDITVSDGVAKIKSSPHSIAASKNIIFVKQIELEYNSEIFGLPSYLIDNVYVISLSREEIRVKLEELYEIDLSRIALLESFFEKRFDDRELVISLYDLPTLQIYSNQLVDTTIEVGDFHISKKNTLFIEGKPGIGKSHLVNNLKVNGEKIIYRFWISNQDYDYQNRLRYDNFISNLTKEIFKKLVKKDNNEIAVELKANNITLIIDGLDHVENYNPFELDKYIRFIESMELSDVKVVILSRPLKYNIKWKIYRLQNWNFDQTCIFLNEQYHLSDYMLSKEIFRITQGYPILVKFVADAYKISKNIPNLPQLDTVNEYYDVITEKYKNKETLGLFLTSNSYFMRSEIDTLLGYSSIFINQILDEHPYLFEIKLNRISLLHDSLNTYLRTLLFENKQVEILTTDIKNKVYESIASGEKQFINRYLYFNFDVNKQIEILKIYADIDYFDNWFKGTVDIEAVQEFYNQLRVTLENISSNELRVNMYYDFSLILNILARDHISNLKNFLYLYVNSLLLNNYNEVDITSSGYIFGMLHFIKEGNYSSLEMIETNNHYDDKEFYLNLRKEIAYENEYFNILEDTSPLDYSKVEMLLSKSSEFEFKEIIEEIFVILYVHEVEDESEFNVWKKQIHDYVDYKLDITAFIDELFRKYGQSRRFIPSVMKSVRYKLKTLGLVEDENEFLKFTLEEFILNLSRVDSYELISYIKDYLRLHLFLDKKIDLKSVYRFFTSYYARKDYTVNNIWKALILFQRKGYLEIEKSVKIIKIFQSKSEKGIRHLLNSYVDNLDKTEFKYFFHQVYTKDTELDLDIFQLRVEKINMLNSQFVEREFFESLFVHRYSKSIDYSDVKNVLYSKYSHEVFKTLEKQRYQISVQEADFNIEDFKGFEKNFKVSFEKNSSEGITSGYEKGYLTIEDLPFIISKKLSPVEIAKLPDEFYCAFSELELYRHFDKEFLLINLQNILQSAICSKVDSIDMYSNLFDMVGNIPAFIDEFIDTEKNFKKLCSSFLKFIKISGVYI